jgi:integrase
MILLICAQVVWIMVADFLKLTQFFLKPLHQLILSSPLDILLIVTRQVFSRHFRDKIVRRDAVLLLEWRQALYRHLEGKFEFCHLTFNRRPHQRQNFVRFGYFSGWRKGEISQLEWRDIQDDVIRLRPEISKTKEGRVLALVGDIAEVIERRRAVRYELLPYVFHRKGKRIGDFRKAWGKAYKLAGVEGKLFHDLRRTAVRNMVRAGVQEKVAMSISGHKTRAIFDRYNIINEQDIREGMLKTQDFLQLGDNWVTISEMDPK